MTSRPIRAHAPFPRLCGSPSWQELASVNLRDGKKLTHSQNSIRNVCEVENVFKEGLLHKMFFAALLFL